jgi:lysophospholipase L1-like esterase
MRGRALFVTLALFAGLGTLRAEEKVNPPELPAWPALTQDPALDGVAYDPSWDKRLYLLTDSVAFGTRPALKKGFPGWKIQVEGGVSVGLSAATSEAKKNTSLPPVAVVALGYNTSWEPGRKNFERHAEQFDKQAESLIKALTARGVKKIVWVMLRDPGAHPSGKKSHKYYESHGFYFSYVNERLRALHDAHPEIALADWQSASEDPSFTADGIHLTAAGAARMVELFRVAIGLPPAP